MIRTSLLPIQEPAQTAVDSLRGFIPESPLPEGAEAVFRFLFSGVPQGVQILGAVVGASLAGYAVWWAWKNRSRIAGWYASRERGLRITIAASILLAIVLVSAAGVRTWTYIQHDNSFCTSCHVMGDATSRFGEAELSGHADLGCHSCHDQSIWASARQLVQWVAERPVEIGDHTPLADAVCESCHVDGEEAVAWQQIQYTAGHRVHYESTETELDGVMCVSCHGAEVHRFVPASTTCGQAECHTDSSITLAGMEEPAADQCAACHQFGELVPALATTDSARATLVPGRAECETCHAMGDRIAEVEFGTDAHNGTCGTCHDPHTQHSAEEAATECASCHTDEEERPFHVGIAHSDVASQCTVCHSPHATAVDASDCLGCHLDVIANPEASPATRAKLRRALPFDTTAALRRSGVEPGGADRRPGDVHANPPPGIGILPFGFGGSIPLPPDAPGPAARPGVVAPAVAIDTFEHARHTSLQCTNCHSNERTHGDLTFAEPRGCQICHHEAPATSTCAACHSDEQLARPTAVFLHVTVQDTIRREREATLAHQRHVELACVDCHAEPVSLAAAVEAATCQSCHTEHHSAEAGCADCHGAAADAPDFVAAHGPGPASHTACSACHVDATIALLSPDSSFCRTCHTDLEPDHQETSELACTSCHMLETPEEYRRRLREGARG